MTTQNPLEKKVLDALSKSQMKNIQGGTSDGWNATTDFVGDAWDTATDWVGDTSIYGAWDATTSM